MSNRVLAAALACRSKSARLYAKPLQNISETQSILEHIISCIKQQRHIQHTVLGVSEGIDNYPYYDLATKHKLPFIVGDETNVLSRLVRCAELVQATDVFRITTECPFTAWEYFDEAWRLHLSENNDVTVIDFVPLGMHFEIYKYEVLKMSQELGNEKERSEYCSLYVRNHPDKFKIRVIKPPKEHQRLDVRVTVDYPEDLIVCRELYKGLSDHLPFIKVEQIVKYLDAHPELLALNSKYGAKRFYWDL